MCLFAVPIIGVVYVWVHLIFLSSLFSTMQYTQTLLISLLKYLRYSQWQTVNSSRPGIFPEYSIQSWLNDPNDTTKLDLLVDVDIRAAVFRLNTKYKQCIITSTGTTMVELGQFSSSSSVLIQFSATHPRCHAHFQNFVQNVSLGPP